MKRIVYYLPMVPIIGLFYCSFLVAKNKKDPSYQLPRLCILEWDQRVSFVLFMLTHTVAWALVFVYLLIYLCQII